MRQRYAFIIALILSTLIQYPINKGFCQEQADAHRFVDNGDGTVTDMQTNLMWQKGDNGEKITFDKAQEYCKTLKLGGYTDWRLPKVDEHNTAVIVELMMPAHEQDSLAAGPFQIPADFYWSDDPTVRMPFNYPTTHVAAMTNLIGGNKESKAYVRTVRDNKK